MFTDLLLYYLNFSGKADIKSIKIHLFQVLKCSLEPLILLALDIKKLGSRVYSSAVCSIVFSANRMKRSESFVAPIYLANCFFFLSCL